MFTVSICEACENGNEIVVGVNVWLLSHSQSHSQSNDLPYSLFALNVLRCEKKSFKTHAEVAAPNEIENKILLQYSIIPVVNK